MRITGGEWAGRPIAVPKGPRIRPTQDRVRQNLFNLIGEKVRGARVLDLFCGSGALGLEALSRGAARVVFVDRSRFALQAVRENLKSLIRPGTFDPQKGQPPSGGLGGWPLRGVSGAGPWEVMQGGAEAAVRRLEKRGEMFELIFLDPPYRGGQARKTLKAITQCAILGPAGFVTVEHEKRNSPPERFAGPAGTLVLQRKQVYGDTALAIYHSTVDG